MHEVERQVLIELPPVLGVDLSITNEVLLLWIAAVVTFAALFFACRRRSLVARGPFQNFFEAVIEFVDKEVVRENIGRNARFWSPFLLSLFFFILFCNLLGLVPVPTFFKSVTSNVNVTAGLALTIFGITFLLNVRQHGLKGFLSKFRPQGVPWWLTVLVVPIEVVTWLVRPMSLAISLFANMAAGHLVIFMFIGMGMGAAYLLKWLPLAGAVVMSGFEIFVSFVQAFIFTILSALYIREALDAAH